MAYKGLQDFIKVLRNEGELLSVKTFVDPVLEITEITDRVNKTSGKALLFEDNGTRFPLLINAFGSQKRMSMAISRKNLDDPGSDIISLFDHLVSGSDNIFKKLSSLPELIRISGFLPSRIRRKGICQQVVIKDPDLSIFPVLKCWPHDGGRFITLPMVHTVHPVTGRKNVGMYRMQVLDSKTTAMHWQRHKTGANHFEEWKKTGKRMPVTVTLGGDPVYTYAATAPLPENIDEYILAGFLRKKKVKLVKCITNDLFVPCDADIVIEGFVDPSEEMIWEGPFGDHTGVYSLADWYPKFHVTCITHSRNAVYPATIVGIPPMEDAWLAKATEKIFLAPIKLALQPEVLDFHMPDAGTAHNLVIVKIQKSYPGQGRKVINSLFGAGQMMFTKYLIVVSGEVDIRNYSELIVHIFKNADFQSDMLFSSGPLDVLDHSSDNFSYGGKLGIDGTVKMREEFNAKNQILANKDLSQAAAMDFTIKVLSDAGIMFKKISGLPVIVAGVDQKGDPDSIGNIKRYLTGKVTGGKQELILAVDHNISFEDIDMIAWQILGNTDPSRDISLLPGGKLLIDGTLKAFSKLPFPRKWPDVVCSSVDTIKKIDSQWDSLGLGPFIASPSIKNSRLSYSASEEVTINRI
ncbi:MAG TPA: menaquinone biosynthesis decarboxylase [Bacteroidales bacterium]|nr:menaquinone biosynthesis decarboxylase [Bacteroidales bacterium]